MVQFKQIQNGANTLQMLEMNEYTAVVNYMRHPNSKKARVAYVKKIKLFFKWFVDYADSILPSRAYQIEPMMPILLPLKNIKSTTNLQSHFRYKIYLLRKYVNHIDQNITDKTVDRYNHDLLSLGCEMDYCICCYEQLKDNTKKIATHTWMSNILTIKDIFSAANELIYIEETPDISNIYLRDLKPNVIFQIRQLIELYGKLIIGYQDIKNSTTGDSIHKFTQIAWEFIEARNAKTNWDIIFPIDQSIIVRINKWSNRFVHSGTFTPTYIQAFILEIISKLLVPSTNSVQIYDGTMKHSLIHGDIRINNYNNLKADFQNYIDNKMGGPGKATIDWNSKEQVAAYIISL